MHFAAAENRARLFDSCQKIGAIPSFDIDWAHAKTYSGGVEKIVRNDEPSHQYLRNIGRCRIGVEPSTEGDAAARQTDLYQDCVRLEDSNFLVRLSRGVYASNPKSIFFKVPTQDLAVSSIAVYDQHSIQIHRALRIRNAIARD
jgi:hypothetical protein